MEERINYKKRRKGLLASVICVALIAGLLYPSMIVQASSSKAVSVTGEDTVILVGEGDSITFGNGVYGNISIEDSTVFPTSGNESAEIRSGGQWGGTLFATDNSYTVPATGGLYVQDAIDFYTYTELSALYSAQYGYLYPVTVDYTNSSFALVTLRSVAGCKVVYMDDSGTVANVDYVLADGSGTATSVWGGLTKTDYELAGWNTVANATDVTYQVGEGINESGLLELYPVWIGGPEPEPEPEPDPEPSKPATAKSAGSVRVSMNGFIFGGSATDPMVVSFTNDVSMATVTYKVAGADDSAYTSQKPTAVGNYTVRVVLPENDTYTQAVATADFSIRYLPAPAPAYELDGTKGENGWYKSAVEITPPEGYEMSVGDRSNFTTEEYEVTEETTGLRIYLRKIATGEMTDVITIANLRVDQDAPALLDMEDGEEIYEDVVTLEFSDNHFKTITIDGKTVEAVMDGNGNYSCAVETGIRRMSYVVTLKDEAGNETKVSLILGPAWLKDGIVGEGDYYLETGEEYHFPAGSEWGLSGDTTVYAGGASFYANKEGEVTFSKK